MLLREIVMYRKEVARKIQRMNFLKSVGHRHSVGHCHPALPSSAVSTVLSSLLEEVTVRSVARRDMIFCFQVGEAYYTGESRTVPWATSMEKLVSLKGKLVEIAVTEKIIRVTASGLKFRLRRFHHASLFSSPGCSQT